MEQLANGQMTSPVSTSASLSLSQLARFNYPPGSAPGPPGVNGSALPSPTGSPGGGMNGGPSGSGSGSGLISPFPLVRQVSENTANIAMTLQQGFSFPSSVGGVGGGGAAGGSHVVLEAFSPVLPASMMGHATTTVAGGSGLPTMVPAPASFALSLPPSALSAHPADSVVGAPLAASSDSPALVPSPAPSPSDGMLLSPNTQAAVSTLASAIPIVSAN